MVLFSLFAVPLLCTFLVSLKNPDRERMRESWILFAKGALSFVPAYIIFAIIRNTFPLTFTKAGIYFYYLFYDGLLFAAMGVAAYLIVHGISWKSDRGGMSEVFVFLSGYYTFNTVLEIIRHYGAYNSYVLFYYPATQLTIILGLSLVVARMRVTDGSGRITFLLAGIAVVAATALVPLLFILHYFLFATLASVVLFIVAVFPYVLLSV